MTKKLEGHSSLKYTKTSWEHGVSIKRFKAPPGHPADEIPNGLPVQASKSNSKRLLSSIQRKLPSNSKEIGPK